MLADERRARFNELASEFGNTAELSRVLGRGDTYLARYLRHRVPYDLEEPDRRKLARFFGVDEETLRPRPPEPYRLRHRRGAGSSAR
ncbi:hypothetical protein [Sphingomonas sp. S2-65]|uniref:hypothetical protein n=1 Tax=Sphingomonas sp. S2-65 TaxID=2903960 RepID=UPI001F2F7FFD|nr:hypothetical protein [Sphingomonas sp. S2-65]UYY60084.1 hypothetical protein LZ586_08410 [Sphingomonas sp. S2-65]